MVRGHMSASGDTPPPVPSSVARARDEISLRCLQRHDAKIRKIICQASFVSVYALCRSTRKWDRAHMQGGLHVVEREVDARPQTEAKRESRWRLFVLNQRDTGVLLEDLDESFEMEGEKNHIFYRVTCPVTGEQRIHAIWVYDDNQRLAVQRVLQDIIDSCASGAGRAPAGEDLLAAPGGLPRHGDDPAAASVSSRATVASSVSSAGPPLAAPPPPPTGSNSAGIHLLSLVRPQVGAQKMGPVALHSVPQRNAAGQICAFVCAWRVNLSCGERDRGGAAAEGGARGGGPPLGGREKADRLFESVLAWGSVLHSEHYVSSGHRACGRMPRAWRGLRTACGACRPGAARRLRARGLRGGREGEEMQKERSRDKNTSISILSLLRSSGGSAPSGHGPGSLPPETEETGVPLSGPGGEGHKRELSPGFPREGNRDASGWDKMPPSAGASDPPSLAGVLKRRPAPPQGPGVYPRGPSPAPFPRESHGPEKGFLEGGRGFSAPVEPLYAPGVGPAGPPAMTPAGPLSASGLSLSTGDPSSLTSSSSSPLLAAPLHTSAPPPFGPPGPHPRLRESRPLPMPTACAPSMGVCGAPEGFQGPEGEEPCLLVSRSMLAEAMESVLHSEAFRDLLWRQLVLLEARERQHPSRDPQG
ncbi:hypothetical protein BESB_023340 [Besnoitia besnoiti]|uniref:mRNA decapping enzyme n=1 Tax=Besnoitia besnoiti TaxID=94643 RepID=A0A2A9M8X0_BESBE|nr:hypothetical protein BESB_023340 [Besnoitia besnoiti]PFH31842.1 hypothetical protein BESB_023340 [Besnoitia besnoiti]